MSNYQEWHMVDKQELGKDFVFPNLPHLIDGELILSETKAIEEYIAHRSGKTELLGKTLKDQA